MRLFSDRRAIAALFTLLWLAGCAGGSTRMNAPAGSCVSLGYPEDPGSRGRLLLTPSVGIRGMSSEELKANIINYIRVPTNLCNDSRLAEMKLAFFEKKPEWPDPRWNGPDWKESIKDAIFECRVILGMTKEQALLSWGQPLKRKKMIKTEKTNLLTGDEAFLENFSGPGVFEKWHYKKLTYDRGCWFYGLTNIANWIADVCLNPFGCFSNFFNYNNCCMLGLVGGSRKVNVGNLFKQELTFKNGILVTIREDD